MTKITFFCCFIGFNVFALSQNIEINFIKQNQKVLPNSTFSLVVKIINKSDAKIELLPRIELPPTWKITNTLNEFSVEPNSSTIQVVTISVPATTESVSYELKYVLVSSKEKWLAEKTTQIEVLKVEKLTLILLNEQKIAKAGSTATSTFLLKNEGNSFQKVKLVTDKGLIADNSELYLSSGQTSLVTVLTLIPITLERVTNLSIKLDAIPTNSNSKTISAYAFTKAVPIIEPKKDAYYRIPLILSANYMGQGRNNIYNSDYRFEAFLKGNLSTKKKQLLELMAVPSNTLNLNFYGQYEQYYANYTTDNIFAHLGDKNFKASLLSEFARFGRGAEISTKINKFEVGAFYNQPRSFDDIKDAFNAYAAFDFTKKGSIRYGFFKKRGKANVNINYVVNTLKINNNIDFEGEYAISDDQSVTGSAYRLQARSIFKKLKLNFLWLNADKNFKGYYTNSRLFNGNVDYKISKKLSAVLNFNKDSRNIERDTLLGTAPLNERYQTGINYLYSKKGRIGVFGGKLENEDLQNPKQFHYKEDYLRIFIDQNIGHFEIGLDGNLSKTNNFLTSYIKNSTFLNTSIGFKRKNTNYIANLGYSKTNRYESPNLEQYIYGGRILGNLSPNTYFNVFYQNSYTLEDRFQDRNLFEMQLGHSFLRNHSISAISSYTLLKNELNRKDFSFMIKYAININVPIKRVAEYGNLTGTIANLGVKTVEGIEVVLGSKSTFTDKNGSFKFLNIVPDTYNLEINKTNLDLYDITNIIMPHEITIASGANFFDFALTKATSIFGKILINETNETKFHSIEKTESNQSIIIEVKNENEVYRKVCPINESYNFSNLRPGKWELTIYRNGLNDLFKIRTTHFNIETVAGDNRELNIEIQKKARKVNFQQEGFKLNVKTNKK